MRGTYDEVMKRKGKNNRKAELTAAGLPVGMQILTRHFDETTMFRLADAFENSEAA